ncbi:MAG: hypothetical protein JO270_08095, partial [Acidobacteriaceae bacterium]|nr:hypothetical protein [Acidobacteriaceae bacterium]
MATALDVTAGSLARHNHEECNQKDMIDPPKLIRKLSYLMLITCIVCDIAPKAYGLPSYARQTGQRCAACHVGGNWPQLTPWGRFFKLAGYAAGKSFVDREGFQYAPVGGLLRTGVTWAAQPTNSQGQTVIAHNGNPELYDAFGELGT